MPRCDERTSHTAVRSLFCVVLAAVALTGCSQALQTPLPELAAISRRLLSDDEQKKAVEEMNLEGQRHQAEAIKDIEQDRPSAATPAAAPPPSRPLTN